MQDLEQQENDKHGKDGGNLSKALGPKPRTKGVNFFQNLLRVKEQEE